MSSRRRTMITTQPLANGARALRAAAWKLPSSAQLPRRSSHASLQRSFSSRTTATNRHVAQRTPPRQLSLLGKSLYCHHCGTKVGLQRQTPQGRRSFHLATFANTTVDLAEAAIVQLHAVTHTPWYITIPLVALGVNVLFRLPFSIHAREVAIKRARLGPLLQAWTSVHGQEVIKERRRMLQEQRLAGGSSGYAPMSSIQAEVIKRFRKTSSRVYAAFGVQQWKLYGNFLALPPWLVVIEALRRMCGAPTGLLGMILRSSSAPETVEVAVKDTATAAHTAAATEAVAESVSTLADPTFVTGGCLWFPDLTAADPYQILPFALSAMLVVNILPSTDLGRRSLFGLSAQSGGGPGPGSKSSELVESVATRALQRTLLLMSIFVGPLTLHFPAAIHLYWLSSAAITYTITRILRVVRPMPSIPASGVGRRELPWIVPPNPNLKGEGGKKDS
ncbi:hypothetical protein SEPCBS119000_003737 [Sporothrix epigloea]|uniref:Mitochondrial export translocase n=1 Tax=Sporothrix epigloea TaxID=1892477 RepID=A0ABP0DND1_9PEZI